MLPMNEDEVILKHEILELLIEKGHPNVDRNDIYDRFKDTEKAKTISVLNELYKDDYIDINGLHYSIRQKGRNFMEKGGPKAEYKKQQLDEGRIRKSIKIANWTLLIVAITGLATILMLIKMLSD
jgi:hypothetical protein